MIKNFGKTSDGRWAGLYILRNARGAQLWLTDYGAAIVRLDAFGYASKIPGRKNFMNDPETWRRIMEVTPMKKWTDPEEVADWVEFLTVRNRSMSGENLLIDNGEYRLRSTFVWPGDTDVVRLR